MILKEKWRRAFLLAGAAALSAAALSIPASAGATLKYPNLYTLPPTDFHLGTALVDGSNQYVIRFSNEVANSGPGTFELHGSPHFPPDGLYDATQWIYDDTAGIDMEPVGTFEFHQAHNHFHFRDFARYEVWTQRDYQRAAAKNFTVGQPIGVSPKVTFCVFDNDQPDPNVGLPSRTYASCTPLMEGLSVGWGDVYDWLTDEQWVALGQTPLPDGNYVLRSIADPFNKIYESPGKADPARESQIANSATADFSIVNGKLANAP